MSDRTYTVTAAAESDVTGILALQELNLPAQGGQLSVRMTADWFRSAISDKLIVVCRKSDQIVGYVAGTPLEQQAHIPVIQAMLKSFGAPDDCYVYGPTCVAAAERGQGLAQMMFEVLHRNIGKSTAITFIKTGNTPSRRAHLRMGMQELGLFSSNGVEFVAMTFTG